MDQQHAFPQSYEGGAGELTLEHHPMVLTYSFEMGVDRRQAPLTGAHHCRRALEQWRASFWTHYSQESSTSTRLHS